MDRIDKISEALMNPAVDFAIMIILIIVAGLIN